MIQLRVAFEIAPRVVDVLVGFLVVDVPSAYNAILGRGTLNRIGAIVSSPHLKIKFYTDHGIGEQCGQQRVARECYLTSLQGQSGSIHQVDKSASRPRHHGQNLKASGDFMPPNTPITLDPTDKAESNAYLELADEIEQLDLGEGKMLNVGKAVQGKAKEELTNFLGDNQSVFAWTAADMPGIPRTIAEHRLHIKLGSKPIR